MQIFVHKCYIQLFWAFSLCLYFLVKNSSHKMLLKFNYRISPTIFKTSKMSMLLRTTKGMKSAIQFYQQNNSQLYLCTLLLQIVLYIPCIINQLVPKLGVKCRWNVLPAGFNYGRFHFHSRLQMVRFKPTTLVIHVF